MKKSMLTISVLDIATYSMVVKTFLSLSVAIPSNDIIDSILTVIFILTVIYSILRKNYKQKELIVIFGISLVLLYTSLTNKYYDPLISFLFIIAIKNSDINSIIKKIYKCNLYMLALHSIFTVVGLISGRIVLINFIRGVYRVNLGFVHPNSFGAFCFVMISMNLWINYEVLNRKKYLFSIFIAVVCFFLSQSRTAFFLSIICIILVMLSKRNALLIKCVNLAAKILFPLSALFVYVLVRLYEKGSEIAILFDNFLTGRINLGAFALNRVGFTYLGRFIDFYGRLASYQADYTLNTFTFDCIYTFMFCSMGLIYVVIFSLLFYLLAKRKNVLINIYLILWILYGITEVTCLNGFNFFPFFLLVVLINKKSYITNEGGTIYERNCIGDNTDL